MYRYILFDLDGTLTDSKEGIINCLRYALEKMGVPMPCEEVQRQFVGPPLQDSLALYCGMTPGDCERAIALFRERYSVLGKFENAAVPGGAALLQRLREKGYRTALASSKPQEMCRQICEKFGFAPHLEVIAGSLPGNDWTKEQVMRACVERMGLTEADLPQVLMVGDRKFDVEGAAACGVDCVGVEFFGYADPGELEGAGAVAVCATVEQLEQFILTH